MGDPAVDKWKQSGRIWLWRYKDNPRNYSGFHICADSAGSGCLVNLVDLMINAQYPSSANLELSTEPVPDPSGCAKKRWLLRSLMVKHPKTEVFEGHWDFTFDADRHAASLTLGTQKLLGLREGVVDITQGRGDFAIGPDERHHWNDQCLWFWW